MNKKVLEVAWLIIGLFIQTLLLIIFFATLNMNQITDEGLGGLATALSLIFFGSYGLIALYAYWSITLVYMFLKIHRNNSKIRGRNIFKILVLIILGILPFFRESIIFLMIFTAYGLILCLILLRRRLNGIL